MTENKNDIPRGPEGNDDDIRLDKADADAPLTAGSDPAAPADGEPGQEDAAPEEKKKRKKHLIRPKWLRIVLKTLMWLIVVVLLIPVLLYIPPVQTFVKNVAADYVYKSTGMKIGIDRFRLGFPVNVTLDGVTVLEQSGDTMVRASHVIADVEPLPLLNLDVRIKRLQLQDGYYRMVSPDSSMILTVAARLLDVNDRSSANIADSEINLDKAEITDGDLRLYMNVWKQKPSPQDTTSTPFLINANDIRLHNFRFAMSMLPTIDTMYMDAADVTLRKGVVNLRTNKINAELMKVAGGSFTYIAPTPEYVAAHPVPVDTTAAPSAPMTIIADSIALDGFDVLYATKGATPLPGFDAAYIQLSEVGVGLRNFFNEAQTVKIPVTRLAAKERSGLTVTRAHGNVDIDSTGLAISGLEVATPYSTLRATAGLPFALMELKPDAPLNATVAGSVGIPDVEAFMPALKTYTSALSTRNPLKINLEADGTLSRADISTLEAAIDGTFSLEASGYADNALDFNKMEAEVDFNMALRNPSLVHRLLGKTDYRIPAFTLDGTAGADRRTFTADFRLRTPEGDVAGKGGVSLTSEGYRAKVDVSNLNVAAIMPSLGLGHVTASLSASGRGFNPTVATANSDIDLDLSSIEYNKKRIDNVKAVATLHNGAYTLRAFADNNVARFNIDGEGTLAPDLYTFDIRADIGELNLYELGMTPNQNAGSALVTLKGSASPERWLYDADLVVDSIAWTIENQFYHARAPITFNLDAQAQSVAAHVGANMTSLDFTSPTGLKNIVDRFMVVTDTVMAQVERRNLDVKVMQRELPPFRIDVAASGRGLLGQFLHASGMSVDTIGGMVANDSLLRADIGMLGLNTGSMYLDTMTLALKERGALLDYRLHLGNRKGNLDELHQVDMNGYVGSNRLLASLSQKNLKGETGYRLGVTAAMLDSSVNLHFTPLKATIAYMPWTINLDNHVEYKFNGRIDANLEARSNESAIALKTSDSDNGYDLVHLKLDNIHVQDFLRMSVLAPPIEATVNSDITAGYNGHGFEGKGTLDIKGFTYEKTRVGDFDFRFKAGLENDGSTTVGLAMQVDERDAAKAYAHLVPDSVTKELRPEKLGVLLTKFPLSIANPFLGEDIMSLSGGLSGDMRMSGSFSEPLLNGKLTMDSVGVYIPMMGTNLRFDNEPLTVSDNVVTFNDYDIWAVNANPITINGSVNARKFSDVMFDIAMAGSNVQLVGTKGYATSDISGKLFVDMNASAKGPMKHFTVNANLNVLPSTDVTYTIPATSAQMGITDAEDVVKFVSFADTTSLVKQDTVPAAMAMRIIAGLNVTQGAEVTVLLSDNGTDKVQLNPYGTLNYFQNFMGDMRLNGQLNLGTGFVVYSVPVIGQRRITFNPDSYVLWNGNVMNPVLNIHGSDMMKANVLENGNSRLVNFNVMLNVTNNLSSPKVLFDMSTDEDMSIQNQLAGMTEDQRSNTAINMLVTGQYNGPGAKTQTGPMTNQLYGFLTSQLNSWAAKTIKGVDLSFGVNQYDKAVDGENSTAMSYSYQLSKSLFNNRFKINVGGNYSTDASADENFSENLISDISFEYILKQTTNMTVYTRLFRHTGYESILEGEITETGVGLVMKRRMANLKHIFRFYRRRRKPEPTDSTVKADPAAVRKDSVENVEKEEVKTELK